MLNNDPTGFQSFFPWIHPKDWVYPAPKHSQGLLDGLQTTINIVSTYTHTQIYRYRPAPPTPKFGIFYDEIPAKRWGDQKIHPADDIHIYGVKLLNDYFEVTENEDPELCHFSLWLTTCEYAISMDRVRIVIPKGTAVCLNPIKTSVGVPRGKVLYKGSDIVSYPRTWIHPEDKHIKYKDWQNSIKRGRLIHFPDAAQIPPTVWTPPDLD